MSIFTNDPLQIITFQSYGTSSHLYCRGRALEDENIDLTKKGFFSLLKNTWKRFETDEIPNTRLKLQLPDDTTHYIHTNHEGYYKIDLPEKNLQQQINSEGWLPYEISYDPPIKNKVIQQENRFPGEMLIPPSTAKFGIISDIDDTILHTGVASFFKWRLIFNTFFKNAESRSPLEGAADFYHMLHQGKTGKEANPLFYVSNSPWNLYRYLELFLQKNKFPKGPILLRDFRAPFEKRIKRKRPHKQHEVRNILDTYPTLKFILIGDAGEHDADIYLEVAKEFPGRILAIYLRSVQHAKKRLRILELFDGFKAVPTLLVESSEEAVQHAKAAGFIA
ncbi:App1 family protein [Luteirhabdus pelagi]|uniref:App1 family protein n=1 Tax=Luteirhabdus pelagi TaxID=2792783 RepID=UPI001939440C|nr:phosphatase domain-containing protein [Luteirhabdus pelagi]